MLCLCISEVCCSCDCLEAHSLADHTICHPIWSMCFFFFFFLIIGKDFNCNEKPQQIIKQGAALLTFAGSACCSMPSALAGVFWGWVCRPGHAPPRSHTHSLNQHCSHIQILPVPFILEARFPSESGEFLRGGVCCEQWRGGQPEPREIPDCSGLSLYLKTGLLDSTSLVTVFLVFTLGLFKSLDPSSF